MIPTTPEVNSSRRKFLGARGIASVSGLICSERLQAEIWTRGKPLICSSIVDCERELIDPTGRQQRLADGKPLF